MNQKSTWERTFVLFKPDTVIRALTGTLITRFEQAGLTLSAMRMESADRKKAVEHYQSKKGESFFEPLVTLLTSGPIVIMALEGANAIATVRKIIGSTEPSEAVPGSIRGDFCHMSYKRSHERLGVIPNLIHASDSPESAKQELALWFSDSDFVKPYERADARFM